MKLSDFIIGIMLFSAVVAGGALFSSDLHQNYGVVTNSSWNETYNKASEISAISDEIFNKTDSSELSVSDFTVVPIIGAVKLVGNSLSLFYDVILNFTTELGFPVWVASILIGLLTTTLTFLIISAILKMDV